MQYFVQIFRQKNRQAYIRWIDEHTNKQTNAWTYNYTDKQIYRQMDIYYINEKKKFIPFIVFDTSVSPPNRPPNQLEIIIYLKKSLNRVIAPE